MTSGHRDYRHIWDICIRKMRIINFPPSCPHKFSPRIVRLSSRSIQKFQVRPIRRFHLFRFNAGGFRQIRIWFKPAWSLKSATICRTFTWLIVIWIDKKFPYCVVPFTCGLLILVAMHQASLACHRFFCSTFFSSSRKEWHRFLHTLHQVSLSPDCLTRSLFHS